MGEFRIIAENVGFTEGPVWTRDRRLLFTSISHSAIYELQDGKARVAVKTGGGPNGMTEGEDGSLYVAQNAGGFGTGQEVPEKVSPGVQRVTGESVRYLIDALDAPNDVCFGPDGRLYFTDPRGWATPENTKPGRVYALDIEGGAPDLLPRRTALHQRHRVRA